MLQVLDHFGASHEIERAVSVGRAVRVQIRDLNFDAAKSHQIIAVIAGVRLETGNSRITRSINLPLPDPRSR